MSFVPAWKDELGNRFFVLAENQIHATREALGIWLLDNFLHYALFGWVTDGVIEIDLVDGQGRIPHVPVLGPRGFKLCVVGGPVFDEAVAAAATGTEGA